MGPMVKVGTWSISHDTKVDTIAPTFPVKIVFQANDRLERDHGDASIRLWKGENNILMYIKFYLHRKRTLYIGSSTKNAPAESWPVLGDLCRHLQFAICDSQEVWYPLFGSDMFIQTIISGGAIPMHWYQGISYPKIWWQVWHHCWLNVYYLLTEFELRSHICDH